jgi:hypothetical protein
MYHGIALWATPAADNLFWTCRNIKRAINSEESHANKTLYNHKRLVLDMPHETIDRDVILAGCMYSLQTSQQLPHVTSTADIAVLVDHCRQVGSALVSGEISVEVDVMALPVAHHQPPTPPTPINK